jgi:hypothetical protein
MDFVLTDPRRDARINPPGIVPEWSKPWDFGTSFGTGSLNPTTMQAALKSGFGGLRL